MVCGISHFQLTVDHACGRCVQNYIMYYLICYDISDNRDRYRVVKALKGFGSRVQKSVFECPDLTEKQLLDLQDKLAALIDHGSDSIHYFRLCKACLAEVEWSGLGRGPMVEKFQVI